jgi:hypothetical protein
MQRRNYNAAILKAVTLACLSIATKLEEVVMLTPDDLQVRKLRHIERKSRDRELLGPDRQRKLRDRDYSRLYRCTRIRAYA